VEAVFAPHVPAEVRRWHDAHLVTIGPATSGRCRSLGRSRVHECSVPSDIAVIAVVASLFASERKDS
jgi:hypothetical protein